MSIIAMPSCPAPLGSSNTRKPSAAIASATCAFSQGAQGTVRFSWVTSICSASSRRFAIASICRTISATARLRCVSEGARMSMVNETCPGITLVAPGFASILPTVPTSPAFVGPAEFLDRDDAFGRARQRVAPQRHRHRAGVAGHAGQSCREPGGARDRRHHADRQVFLLPAPAPARCAVRHRPSNSRRARAAAPICVGIEAECAIASRIEMPARSRVLSTLSSNVPATARLPSSVEAKRTPSSSANPTTSIANGNRFPRAVQIGHAGDRRDQSERAVPFAGVAHGVVMRAQHQARQAGPLAFVTAADVSDRVEMRASFRPRASRTGSDRRRCGAPARKIRARCSGVSEIAAELIDPANDLIAKRR